MNRMLSLLVNRPAYVPALLLFICFTIGQVSFANSPCKVINLRCEYLKNPLGIDAKTPRLTWQLSDDRQGAKQTAFQIFVSTDSSDFASTKYLQWNSGKINASSTLVQYNGKPLQPFTKYYWKLIVWDKDGVEASTSPVSNFETGMMDKKNWKGTWISDGNDASVKPAPYFRKVFETNKKIKAARVYIAAAGLYELYLNGNKVGNHRLDPTYTRFDRRNLYVSYDATPQLQDGKNAIGVLLGNGWYNHQSTAVWNFHNAPWRNRPAFCLDLRITYDDGSTEVISSDKSWKTSLSPVIFNSIYTAEHYDANQEQSGWSTINFVDLSWKSVINRSAPSQNIVAQVLHPIRNIEEIKAASFTKLNDTVFLYDLGKNISGVSQITVKGEQGTVLRLKHGERLTKNGRVDLSNIDVHYRPTDHTDPFQTDIFILSGKGDESFMPLFNYKGFQYVEVISSRPVSLKKENLVCYFMHSDVPAVGNIKSSNATLDKIWWATNNSYLSNLFGYPTDCPQREKNGWTGDAHIAIETGLYNFDAITVYEKWLADFRDEQQPNGVLPSIVPTGGWGYEWGNGPDWTSAIAIIPWNIYLFYGDTSLLGACYDNIKRCVDYITEQYPTGLTTWGLGDWVPVKTKSPVELTSSIYYFADAQILSKAAALLGKNEDHKKYELLAEKIKTAINKKYLDESTGIYANGSQTELSAPLYWGVVPEHLKAKVAANLAKRVAGDKFHLDVGLLGTKSILNALSENGYADVAYKIAAQETYPSWGWWIVNGATTLYENWDIKAANDISLNHIMFGEIGAWLYKALGGIKPNEKSPGFREIVLEPHFVAGLNAFDAMFNSPNGIIASSWKKEKNSIVYNVTVPPNTSAVLFLRNDGKNLFQQGKMIKQTAKGDRKQYTLQAGVYQFEIK